MKNVILVFKIHYQYEYNVYHPYEKYLQETFPFILEMFTKKCERKNIDHLFKTCIKMLIMYLKNIKHL